MKKLFTDALLLYGTSEQDPNLFYATQMFVPDPFFFIQKKNKKMILLNDLEIDRGKKEAAVDQVLSYSQYQKKILKRSSDKEVIVEVLKDKKIKSVTVPSTFPIELGDHLRKNKIKLEVKKGTFFPQRRTKSAKEVKQITQTLRHVETALGKAITFLKQTKIKGPYLWHKGKKVLPEDIKSIINVELMKNNCVAQHTIVACGEEACDPHNTGSKPLRAHQAIVMDIFPRSISTGYFADITRTVVRGTPSEKLKKLYQTVLEAQKMAIKMIQPGINGTKIHQAICSLFESKGYLTGIKNGRMQGFFHGTGHGLGLEIHEAPRISYANEILKPGDVITVEPGLYYRGLGGIRIEDDILVTKTGAKNLTLFSKKFKTN